MACAVQRLAKQAAQDQGCQPVRVLEAVTLQQQAYLFVFTVCECPVLDIAVGSLLSLVQAKQQRFASGAGVDSVRSK